jgi:small subunit ribosomal protein S18
MLQYYEIYIILDGNLDGDNLQNQINKITTELETQLLASNISIENEGLKKFVYPIKKQWSGNYISITFDLSLEKTIELRKLEKKLNLTSEILRYLLLNQTEFLKLKSKEKEYKLEFENRQDFNKGKKDKQCYIKYLGLQAIDFRDSSLLSEFTSPYAKIFDRKRTGTSSKYQRKLSQAIKRARHMGLLPFSSKWI